MKINRFEQFVKKTRIFEDNDPIETPETFEDEDMIDTEDDMEDDSNLMDEAPESDEFGGEDLDGDFAEEESDFDETPISRQRNVRSFDDFSGESDDEDLSDEEEIPGGEFSETEPDEVDYMPEFDGEEEGEEEESGEYRGDVEMRELADMLGAELVNNQIEYEGKKINYFSETEMFHVDKKKFKTKEEVIDYLEGGMGAIDKTPMRSPMESEEETGDEGMEMEMPEEEEEMRHRGMAMESRRFLRRK